MHPERTIAAYTDFDANGNATRQRTGTTVGGAFDMRLTFDRAGRLTSVAEAGTSARPIKSFTYGTTGASNGKLLTAVRYNYDASINNPVITETYTYGGKQGRVASRKTISSTISGGDFNASFTWNDLGQLATVTYPGCSFSPCSAAPGPARTVTSNYTNGYLTSVGGFTNTITYHPNGLTNAIPHVNGMTVTQANDPFRMMRPASITATVGAATPWASGTYAYDGAGNIKGIGSNFYYYDLVSRVVDGTAEYTSGSVHKRQTYGYDPYGNMNRITTVVNGAQTENFLMSPSTTTNRLTTSATYDDSGNQTQWGSWLYAFDGLNMMQSNNNGARTLRYVYTADDERIAIHDGTTVKWRLRGVDNKVLREYRLQGGTWSWQKDHVYRGSSLLASDEPSIGVRHFALDHLGTPRLITSSTGATVSLHNYYPFGQEATSETQDAEVMKFTGHERDTEFTNALSSLDYMHARYYSVRLGRFLSVDPAEDSSRIGAPQSWNRYSYALNAPVHLLDPDGLSARASIPANLPRHVPPIQIGQYTYHFDATHADIDVSGPGIKGKAKARLRADKLDDLTGQTPRKAIKLLKTAIRDGELPTQAYRFLEAAGNQYLKDLAKQGTYKWGARALGPIGAGLSLLMAETANADDGALLEQAKKQTPICGGDVVTDCLSTDVTLQPDVVRASEKEKD